jgi:ComF family protein
MSVAIRALGLLVPPFCWACGADAGRAEPLCGECRRELRWLGGDAVELAGIAAWAPLVYEGPAQALVRALKFRGAIGLAGPMAAQIAARAPAALLAPGAELVPVPLHRARLRRRGFNQAERLAVAISQRTGLPVADCLRRAGRAAARQVGRGREERLSATAGAVSLAPRARAPARAVLVDDVVTTGATLAACAAVLRHGGARDVCALAYARTPAR